MSYLLKKKEPEQNASISVWLFVSEDNTASPMSACMA